jgi:uncharacterized protein DUF222/HNH endonuclease
MDRMDDVPLDELGDRICELAAHISAAQYRWLRMLACFDRRCGWGGIGMKSCAHWLSWKCGYDLRSAREKLRVAHALDDLPLICEAFSRGEISYSKVRAITRIATASTEAELLMLARHGTTQHVEKIVRGYRRCLPNDVVDKRYDKRYLDWRYDDDGSVVIRARLTPEEGALVVEAIERVRHEVRAVRHASADGYDGSAEPSRDRVDALTTMARRELAGEKAKSSSGDRYTVMVHVEADGAGHIDGGPALGSETLRRLTCDGALVAVLEDGDEVLNVGRKTRTISPALRRALAVRDDGCAFPGCAHKSFVDGHHVRHWSNGGETALSNLISLCTFHHRLVHEGGVQVVAKPDGRFTFSMKDGRVLETAALSVEPGGVERANAELGLTIDGKTIVPRWAGERCDYGVAVEGLLRINGVGAEPSNGSAEPFDRNDDLDELVLGPSGTPPAAYGAPLSQPFAAQRRV